MSSSLRNWQRQCIEAALQHYSSMQHFFCQATPGAGKTWMAAELARKLLQQGKIDLVLCFAPSRQVVEGFRSTFSTVLGKRLDGLMGAIGTACTYQSMEYQKDAFWRLFEEYRVFAVFDEIHHCAGHDSLLSNAWGQQIIQNVQDRAAFTLALSGTPWRSDDKGIALARYSNPEGRLICDYSYGLKDAVADNVCRSPRIVLLDNHSVALTEDSKPHGSVRLFPSIAELLDDSPVSYEDILRHPEVLQKMLGLGIDKLNELRTIKPDAAALVVATDVEHAHQVALALESMGENCQVVTNRSAQAQHLINRFRHGDSRWIVAVGMISEGTDIPRLQVCCHLSRIRTELHYRQVLGRVLRRTGELDDQAWLFVLAEATLEEFSQRVADDLPEDLAVIDCTLLGALSTGETEGEADEAGQFVSTIKGAPEHFGDSGLDQGAPLDSLPKSLPYQVSFSQQYRRQLLAIF